MYIVKPKEMAIYKEIQGISKLCIWDGSGTFALFLVVVLTLFHIVGRTYGIVGLLKYELTLSSKSSVPAEYPFLKVNVTQTKLQMESSRTGLYSYCSNIILNLHFL